MTEAESKMIIEIKSLAERNLTVAQSTLEIASNNRALISEMISMMKDILASLQTIIALCSKTGSGELLAVLTQLKIAVENMSGKIDTLIAKS